MELFEIAPDFLFLESKGMSAGDSDYSAKSFGNAYLVMLSVAFSIRFTRDRGQVFADIIDKEGESFQLERVLTYVDRSFQEQSVEDPSYLQKMAHQLNTHWSDVANLFADPHQMLRLQVFVEQRNAKYMEDTFPGLMGFKVHSPSE